jgi:tetratricopeptide (TPR) repeat protein
MYQGNSIMPKAAVTEQEIEKAEKLSAQREFGASLAMLQEMLTRANDVQVRMRLLFDVVTCSTWLNRNEILNEAVRELKRFPDYDVSHAFVVMTQVSAFVDFGRAQEALELINANIKSPILKQEEFQDWKYEYLFLKGRSLTRLARCDEALQTFDEAHGLYANGKFEVDILLDRANCLLYLGRYDESFEVASQVQTRGDEDTATLAMQYMAECRMWQSRVPEALDLYVAIQKRLPCRLVEEERIRTGIKNAMARLEKLRPQGKPS